MNLYVIRILWHWPIAHAFYLSRVSLDNTFTHSVAHVRDALLKQHTSAWFKPNSRRFKPCENLLVFHFLCERFPYTMKSSR